MQVPIADLGLAVLIDLVNFSASVDAQALSGKQIKKGKPMSIAQMKTGVR